MTCLASPPASLRDSFTPSLNGFGSRLSGDTWQSRCAAPLVLFSPALPRYRPPPRTWLAALPMHSVLSCLFPGTAPGVYSLAFSTPSCGIDPLHAYSSVTATYQLLICRPVLLLSVISFALTVAAVTSDTNPRPIQWHMLVFSWEFAAAIFTSTSCAWRVRVTFLIIFYVLLGYLDSQLALALYTLHFVSPEVWATHHPLHSFFCSTINSLVYHGLCPHHLSPSPILPSWCLQPMPHTLRTFFDLQTTTQLELPSRHSPFRALAGIFDSDPLRITMGRSILIRSFFGLGVTLHALLFPTHPHALRSIPFFSPTFLHSIFGTLAHLPLRRHLQLPLSLPPFASTPGFRDSSHSPRHYHVSTPTHLDRHLRAVQSYLNRRTCSHRVPPPACDSGHPFLLLLLYRLHSV